VFKILISFGYFKLDYLYIVLVVVSLLLLALSQSYASARKMKFGPALLTSLGILVVGLGITYFTFDTLFSDLRHPETDQHIAIYTYGFMLMLAFIIGTVWLIIQGKKEKPPIEADTILDLMVFIIIGSIVGARLIYTATQPQDYEGENVRNILKITEGGLSIHGGIIGAMFFGWLYCRFKGLEYWKMVDLVIPGVALGQFFGRIGCWLNGCCYGIKCDIIDQAIAKNPDSPLKDIFVFPNEAVWRAREMDGDLARFYDAGTAAIGQYARHPTQIYEAIGVLAIFFYLVNFRKNKMFTGHVFLMYVWLYSVLRFLVENFRFGSPTAEKIEDIGSSIVLWKFITLAQLASIILGIVALFLMQDLKRRTVLARMLKDGKEEPVEAEPEVDEEEEYETEEVMSDEPAEEVSVEEEVPAEEMIDVGGSDEEFDTSAPSDEEEKPE